MYSTIDAEIWRDQKIRGISEDGRWLFYYLLTCPHRNVIGFFRLPPVYATDDLQWTEKRYKAALQSLADKGFIFYDESENIILIKNFLKWNSIKSRSQIEGAASKVRALPNTELLSEFRKSIDRYINSASENILILHDAIDRVSACSGEGIDTLSIGYQEGTDRGVHQYNTVTVNNTVTETVTVNNNNNSNTSSSDAVNNAVVVDNFSVNNSIVDNSQKIKRKHQTGSHDMSLDIDNVFDLYNQITAERLKKVSERSEARRKRIKALLQKYGIEKIKAVFEKAKDSDYLCLTTGENWGRCNFDWLLQEEKFIRTLEGAYDKKERIKPSTFQNSKPNPGNFYDQRQRMMLDSIREEEEKERLEAENEKVRNEKNIVHNIDDQPASDTSER